jgi:hypothetical protein
LARERPVCTSPRDVVMCRSLEVPGVGVCCHQHTQSVFVQFHATLSRQGSVAYAHQFYHREGRQWPSPSLCGVAQPLVQGANCLSAHEVLSPRMCRQKFLESLPMTGVGDHESCLELRTGHLSLVCPLRDQTMGATRQIGVPGGQAHPCTV